MKNNKIKDLFIELGNEFSNVMDQNEREINTLHCEITSLYEELSHEKTKNQRLKRELANLLLQDD